MSDPHADAAQQRAAEEAAVREAAERAKAEAKIREAALKAEAEKADLDAEVKEAALKEDLEADHVADAKFVEEQRLEAAQPDASVEAAAGEAALKVATKKVDLEAEADAQAKSNRKIAGAALDAQRLEGGVKLEGERAVAGGAHAAALAQSPETAQAAVAGAANQAAAITAEAAATGRGLQADTQTLFQANGFTLGPGASYTLGPEAVVWQAPEFDPMETPEARAKFMDNVCDVNEGQQDLNKDLEELRTAFREVNPKDLVAHTTQEVYASHVTAPPLGNDGVSAVTLLGALVATQAVKYIRGYEDPAEATTLDYNDLRIDDPSSLQLKEAIEIQSTLDPGSGDTLRNTYAAHCLANPDVYPALDSEMDAQLAPYTERLHQADQRISSDVTAGLLPSNFAQELRTANLGAVVNDFTAENRCAHWSEVERVAPAVELAAVSQETSASRTDLKDILAASKSSNSATRETERDAEAKWVVAATATSISTSTPGFGGFG